MAKPALPDHATIEEYLEFEETVPEKYELYRGQIYPKGGYAYAMVGGSTNHDDLIVTLTALCVNALRGKKPWRFVGENRRLLMRSKGTSYRPDGAIACPPNDLDRRKGTYDNPTVIFEVLSPATERFDRRGKADDYKTLASLQDYVLIESETVRVEVFSRQADGSWAQRVYLPGTVAHLPSVDVELPLDVLYENAVFSSSDEAPVEE